MSYLSLVIFNIQNASRKFQQHVFGFPVASLIFCKSDLLTSFSKSVEKMPILLFFFSAVHLLSRFRKNVVLSVLIKVSVASVWFSSSKSDFLQIGSFSKSVEKMSNLLLFYSCYLLSKFRTNVVLSVSIMPRTI